MINPDILPDLICRVCHTTLDVHTQTVGGVLVDIQFLHPPAYKVLEFPEHDPDPVQARSFDERVGICDFCSAPTPNWTYPATTFSVEHAAGPYAGSTSIGNWAACDACHDLIEAGDYNALSERGLDTQDMPEFMRNLVRPQIRAYHKQFKANRIGAAIHIMYGTP